MHKKILRVDMGIPERVSIAIMESGLEDDEIAELVKKDKSTINRWRNKETKNYSKNKLKIIADALGISYKWLRFGKGSMKDVVSDAPSIANPDEIDPEAFGELSVDGMMKYLEHIELLSRNVRGSLRRLKNGISSDE